VSSARAALLLLPLSLVTLAACEEKGYEPPPETHRLELADSLYSPTLFDTVTWPSSEQRITAGNLVYADYCRRCHGSIGEGGLARVAGRELHVPSLVGDDWRFEQDIDAVRERVFTGHTGGMPSWGISRLTPREIDAVSYYLLEQLRPEILSERPGGATGSVAPTR
jgi:mono/diheme cytochrome c family protein